MRRELVNIDHENFAGPLTVCGTMLPAERDVGLRAGFELDSVLCGMTGVDLTTYLSEALLNELADDAFEILMEQGR